MVLQPRQERHLCRTSLPTQNSPAPSGVATSGDYAAPTGLAEMFASGLLQRCRAYGAAARRRRRSPPRPQGRKGGAGRKIDNGAPDDGGHEMCRGQSRTADGPRSQRVDRLRGGETSNTVVVATRCEPGRLALRSRADTSLATLRPEPRQGRHLCSRASRPHKTPQLRQERHHRRDAGYATPDGAGSLSGRSFYNDVAPTAVRACDSHVLRNFLARRSARKAISGAPAYIANEAGNGLERVTSCREGNGYGMEAGTSCREAGGNEIEDGRACREGEWVAGEVDGNGVEDDADEVEGSRYCREGNGNGVEGK